MRALALSIATAAALAFPVSASAEIFYFEAFLNGTNEAPPNASPGIGYSLLIFDNVANTMRIQATFQDLIGTTTQAHIHAPTVNPNTGTVGIATELPSFTGFPLGVSSGVYDHTFDTSLNATWNTAFRNNNGGTALGAAAAFLAALQQERAYLNIHSSFRPGGEIRDFYSQVSAAEVPEPTTWALMIGGFGAVGVLMRRRRVARA